MIAFAICHSKATAVPYFGEIFILNRRKGICEKDYEKNVTRLLDLGFDLK